jgi:hypothetical protein
MSLAQGSDGDDRIQGLPEMPPQVRTGLAETKRRSSPLVYRIVEVFARASPLRTLGARMRAHPNPSPLGPRVLWDVSPPPASFKGPLLWQLALQTPARRPKNLQPHEQGTEWHYHQVDDVLHFLTDWGAFLEAPSATARREAARVLCRCHPRWLSSWFAKPSVRHAIVQVVRAAQPEAARLGRTGAEYIRSWITDEVLLSALLEAFEATHDPHALARLTKRLAGERILATAPRTEAEDPARPITIDEAAAHELALLEQLLAAQPDVGEVHDAVATLPPGSEERLEQLEGRGALNMTAALAAQGDLVRFTVLERAVAEHLVQGKSVAESAGLLERTVRQIYDARARVRLKVRQFAGRRRA